MSQAASILGVEITAQSEEKRDTTMNEATPLSRKRVALSSGDDLGGDFEGLGMEDEGGEGKKKKRMKAK